MAVQQGRDMLLKISDGADTPTYQTVAGLRARTVSLNARAVEVTDSDSGGWRELLEGSGVRSLAISGSGVFRDAASDATMRDAFFAQAARDWQIIVPGFGQFAGAFLIAALEYAGQHDGEATFAITLASSGEVSFASV
ncbi:phage major tail protein, TP901-1 family [Asticcacaulis sp. EMRT-3]|uniref:phage major tail protein, TP901-1 family n=1 Tax=Asticcacaulis sp. EMRT-3 TaxID=3040349 RepID=UPI0024AFF257|nr:phage major tail protein, TP901-1 family [Asticcacaulis sp. EMRT-3]MDI7775382.1 phage major tail protein, TP901-1 family [Asticcacaulis sp. EMRT-3]